MRRIGFIVASLEKAGVPPEELQHFKQVVSRLPLANAAGSNAATPTVASGPEVVAEGVLEKLQRGTQGFAPVWKSRWIRILPGELQVFETAGRPERPDTPFLFSLPLSVQQTRIDPGEWKRQKLMQKRNYVPSECGGRSVSVEAISAYVAARDNTTLHGSCIWRPLVGSDVREYSTSCEMSVQRPCSKVQLVAGIERLVLSPQNGQVLRKSATQLAGMSFRNGAALLLISQPAVHLRGLIEKDLRALCILFQCLFVSS